jgi:hypothetical protein
MAALTRLDALPLALLSNGRTVEIPAGFLRDLVRPLLLVERVALPDLPLAVRAELFRGREGAELALRLLLAARPRPVRFVFVWAICLPPFPIFPTVAFRFTHALTCDNDARGIGAKISPDALPRIPRAADEQILAQRPPPGAPVNIGHD